MSEGRKVQQGINHHFDHLLGEKPPEQKENLLIVMVGLPRSGKTTWARKQGFPIVNPDSIRLSLHGSRFLAMAEPFVWAIAGVMVRALFLAGHWTVIVDGCHVKQKYRDYWQSDMLVTGWQTNFMHIDASKDECQQRALREDDTEIMPIIDKMAEEFEPLAGGEVYYPVSRDFEG